MTTTETTTITRPSADELNSHLENGGVVQVTTYLRSTIYSRKHAGYFLESKDGALIVRHGKTTVRLSCGQRMLVGLRLGRVA